MALILVCLLALASLAPESSEAASTFGLDIRGEVAVGSLTDRFLLDTFVSGSTVTSAADRVALSLPGPFSAVAAASANISTRELAITATASSDRRDTLSHSVATANFFDNLLCSGAGTGQVVLQLDGQKDGLVNVVASADVIPRADETGRFDILLSGSESVPGTYSGNFVIPSSPGNASVLLIAAGLHANSQAPGTGFTIVTSSSAVYHLTLSLVLPAGVTCTSDIPPGEPPTASFTFSPEAPTVGETVTFDASSSSDPDGGQIRKFTWDFGDGNSAEGQAVTHAFTETGEFTVTLTVTDDDGLTGSSLQVIKLLCGVSDGGAPIPLDVGSLITGMCPPGPLDFVWERDDLDGNGLVDMRLMNDIVDDAGNRVAVWCMQFLPREPGDPNNFLYRMFVTAAGRTREFAGQCPFCGGWNAPIVAYHTGNANRNDKLDCILTTKWVSTEGANNPQHVPVDCNRDGIKERIEFVYDVLTGGAPKITKFELSKPVLISSEEIVPSSDPPPPPIPAHSGPMGIGPFSLADLNQDGVVDAKDSLIFQEAFGSVRGENRYDPRADLDGDGHVTITDQQILSRIVIIDIKPGSFPNSVNPRSKGVIPVAILTTDTFDATMINPLSVKFGPSGAKEVHREGHIEDSNGDGRLDLVLHFNTQNTGIVCGQVSASLTGETVDGRVIQGSDSINTVGCK